MKERASQMDNFRGPVTEKTQQTHLMPFFFFPQGRREYSSVTSKTPSFAEFSKRVLLPHAGHDPFATCHVNPRIFYSPRSATNIPRCHLRGTRFPFLHPHLHNPSSDCHTYSHPTAIRWWWTNSMGAHYNVLQHIIVHIQGCHVAWDSSPSFPQHVRSLMIIKSIIK